MNQFGEKIGGLLWSVSRCTKHRNTEVEHGWPVYFTTCGVCLHSSLALTLEGLPLGLAAVKFWSRKTFKGRAARRKAHRAPIEEKGSFRWLGNLRSSTELLRPAERCVHVGNQESDIFDLFCVARQLGTHFLVRTRANRLANGGPQTVAETVGQSPRRGLYRTAVRNHKGLEHIVVWLSSVPFGFENE